MVFLFEDFVLTLLILEVVSMRWISLTWQETGGRKDAPLPLQIPAPLICQQARTNCAEP